MEHKLRKLSDRLDKAEKYLDDNSIADSEKDKYVPLFLKLNKELTEIITKVYNIKL